MKKKFLYLSFMTLFAFASISCKSKTTAKAPSSAEAQAVEKTNDLTGIWKSDYKEEMQMEAVIENDTIQVKWVANDGETKALYWIGSYLAPNEPVSEYQWISIRDKERTATAFLASLDETKIFQYSNGNLSYEIPSSKNKKIIYLTKE